MDVIPYMKESRSMRSASSVVPGQHLAAALGKALIALASVAILAVTGIAPAAAGDRPPGGVLTNPVVRAIDLASPAVVRIATLYSAHVTLSACGITATLPASGAYTVGGLGSGAFVSAHGDILTADHVVDIDRQSLDASIFEGQRSSADVATFLNTACHPSVPVTPNDVASGIVQFNGFPFTIGYSSRRVLVWRSTSYLGAISAGQAGEAVDLLSGLLKAPYNEASVVKFSSFTDDDIALIHVGLTDTPNIQLDPSSQLAVEDSLAVIGFPGNGDVNGDPTNLLTPSVNNVSVSALKRNDNGSQLIQVGGNVEHGDSGGPVLDTAGRIVGIVSFGGPDIQGITAFLRSSDSALTLLNLAHIDQTPGTFQKLWQQAFADYVVTTPGHWHTASREMDDLSARYPDFHGADVYRAYADTAAIHESTSSSQFNIPSLPLPLPIMAGIVGGVVLLLLLLIIIASVRRRARRRAKQQAAPVPLPSWPSAGLPQGYNGATAPSYPQMSYNDPAPPTRPASPQQRPDYVSNHAQGYPSNNSQVYPPSYAPYSGYMPQSSAPQGRADGQSRPVSSSTPPSGDPQERGAVDRCVNGHQMPSGVPRCLVCGAERAQPASSAPRDVNPWAQNW